MGVYMNRMSKVNTSTVIKVHALVSDQNKNTFLVIWKSFAFFLRRVFFLSAAFLHSVRSYIVWLIAFHSIRLPVDGFTMGIKSALPRYELYLYTAVLGVALIWAGSWIFEASSGEFMKSQRHVQSTCSNILKLNFKCIETEKNEHFQSSCSVFVPI